jgi:hypothetical protein
VKLKYLLLLGDSYLIVWFTGPPTLQVPLLENKNNRRMVIYYFDADRNSVQSFIILPPTVSVW